MKATKGFSVMLAFGSWAKPTIQTGDFIALRICLGFLALSFYRADMENFLVNVMNERRSQKYGGK